MEVAFKIDVDTHRGLGEGVPRLRQLLEREQATATFFVAMGPDNSGRAALRAFRNRGFLSKMFRTRAVAMYGLRTVLSGTLLPSRPIALAWPELMRQLKRAGFEVGIHGYDHVLWQDRIDRLGEAGIRAEVADALEAYLAIFSAPALSFAAPGWRTNAAALAVLDEAGLAYRSDTRGVAPYRCAVEGRIYRTPEIPTTLPTLDEVMGRRDLSGGDSLLNFYLGQFREDALNVHTIHAETEGMGQIEMFARLVRALKERGARFVRLDEAASRLESAGLAVCEVVRKTLPGRSGWIAAQGPEAPPQ